MSASETVWVGTIDSVARYQFLVVGHSADECERALRAELADWVESEAVIPVWGDEDPMEYYGAHIRELRLGKVETN